MNKIAVYPGSFDPVTKGHLDILKRASLLFSKVIIAVVDNPNKKCLFTMNERVDLLKKSVNIDNVIIDRFSGLLVNYVEDKGGVVIIRGLRALSDFEYEFQMAHMNKKLNDRIETIFISADNRYTFISSNTIKEVARLNGDFGDYVTQPVLEALNIKFNK